MNENNQDSKKCPTKLIQEIISGLKNERYIYRGVNKKHTLRDIPEKKRINSLIYRKYTKEIRHLKPLPIEKELLRRAQALYPPNTSEVEILTDLRHFGAPTALIDFTHNLYIALFFACNGEHNKDGELILYSIQNKTFSSNVNYEDESMEVRLVVPSITENSRNRVLFQSSVFIHTPEGYVPIKDCKIKRIRKGLKKSLLEHLDRFYNIKESTVYNDLTGFINNEENFEFAHKSFYKGLDNYNSEKYEKAIKDLDKAIKFDPKFDEAYCYRGQAKAGLERYKESIKDYDRAIELNPRFDEAYYSRGNVKAELGRYKEAIKDYDKAIELDPKFDGAYYFRGKAKAELGRYKEAIKDYDKAIELDPKFDGAYYFRGKAKAELGRYKEAIKDYDKAIKLDPKFGGAYYFRGNTKAELGRYKEAIKDYDKAIKLNPKFDGAYYFRGKAKAELGRYKEAIKDYDKAIKLNPKFDGVYYFRGKAKAELGRYKEAIKDYDKAIKLNPKFDEAYCSRGNAKVELGRYKEALQDYFRVH